MAKKLSPRQEEFIRIYLSDPARNASDAYRKAGFNSKNPDVDAAQLLVNPSIKPKVDEYEAKIKQIAEEKFGITQERILQDLAEIAFTKPTEIVEWSGDTVTMKNSADLTERQKASVSKVQQGFTDTGRKYVKLEHYDRVAALKTLGAHLGMWSKNVTNKDGAGDNPRDPKIVLSRLSQLLSKRK
jgi:phage terminase small subunit